MEIDQNSFANPLTRDLFYFLEDQQAVKLQKRTIQLLSPVLLLTVFFFFLGCGGGGTNAPTKAVDQTETLGNLRSLNAAVAIYAQDYDLMFPNASTFDTLKPILFPYHRDSSNYTDPNTNIPFAWNGYLSGKMMNSADFTGFATFYVVVPVVPNARPVATFNGSSKLVTDTEWAQLKATSHIP